jgi:hypothetical protein
MAVNRTLNYVHGRPVEVELLIGIALRSLARTGFSLEEDPVWSDYRTPDHPSCAGHQPGVAIRLLIAAVRRIHIPGSC